MVAQRLFGGLKPVDSPMDGLLVYVVAAVLFTIVIVRSPQPRVLPLDFRLSGLTDNLTQVGISLALVLFSGAVSLSSLSFFEQDVQPGLRWWLYLLSIALFVSAVYALVPFRRMRSESEPRPKERLARWEWIALAIVLLVALAFRVARLHEVPYGLWYDEADNGLAVRQILANPTNRPIYVPSTNLPAHFLYLIALSFRLLGDSMYAIRAVAVAFGLLTVVAAYFCGRELFGIERGRVLGIVLAAMVAVSRWDVNWSRIGMHGVTLPFFELWVVAALLRGLRTGRITSFAWAGLATGLGLCFYSPFRLFPAVVAIFGLVWFWNWIRHALHTHRGRALLRHAVSTWTIPVLLFVLGIAVTVAPVAEFAVRRPEVFWDRAKRISVFQDPNVQARPVAAILESTTKHLLMFNYQGDPNGRHNLPGAPMLDPFSGTLMVLGVLVALLSWNRPRSVLLILWLLASLSGGILSTWFEAPQSLRSFGAMPAAYALACLPLEWLADEWHRVFPAVRSKLPLRQGAIALLLAIGLQNGLVYFYFWANDFASWAAFNPAETHMAQTIARYRENYDLLFDPLLTAHLATRYLIPDFTDYHNFDPATVLPLASPDKTGTVLFVAPDTWSLRDQIATLYPNTTLEKFTHQSGRTVLYSYIFSRERIDEKRGLDARYVPLQATTTDGLARTDQRVDFTWQDEPPLPYPFEAVWTGGLLVDTFGQYAIQVDVPGECYLALDGQVMIDAPGAQRREVTLATGVHALYLDCQVTESGPVRLSWQHPGSEATEPVPAHALFRSSWPVNGLLGMFYQNDNWSGDPVLERIDRQVAYYFHFLPLARPYTVQWTGRLLTPASGTYTLGLKAISSASLSIDGQILIEPSLPGEVKTIETNLASGLHDIEVRYLDDQSHSQVYLYWEPPDGDLARIPAEMLFLPQDGAWHPVQ